MYIHIAGEVGEMSIACSRRYGRGADRETNWFFAPEELVNRLLPHI